MILYLDTETTDLWDFKSQVGATTQPLLVQLAAVLADPDGTERMRLDVVIFRDQPIPARATQAHGITSEFSNAYGVTEKAALTIFQDLVEAATTVVAHNLTFDENVIKNALCLAGRDYRDPFQGRNKVCTMKWSTNICRIPHRGGRGFKFPTLAEAHQILLGEGFDGAHQAINDVLACKRVCETLSERLRSR